MSAQSIRVVVGEDSFLTREAISAVLTRAEGVELVAMCPDLESLRRTIDQTTPDVVLTDIRMPPEHLDEGIKLAEELRETHPDIGVVVLSSFAEPTYAALLFESGSEKRAYLLKERLKDRDELIHTLEAVAEGGSAVDPVVVEQLLALHRHEKESRLATLTPRELEVLHLIAEGKSNGAIADEFVVTKRAVERHVNSIFMKLGLHETQDVSRRVRATLVYLADVGR